MKDNKGISPYFKNKIKLKECDWPLWPIRGREKEKPSPPRPPCRASIFLALFQRFMAGTPTRLPISRSAHLLPPLSLSHPQLPSLPPFDSVSLSKSLFLSAVPSPPLTILHGAWEVAGRMAAKCRLQSPPPLYLGANQFPLAFSS